MVFAKAYALVAVGSPPLRRVYVKLPWPHLYELPQSVVSIATTGRSTAAARAIRALKATLNSPVLDELRALADASRGVHAGDVGVSAVKRRAKCAQPPLRTGDFQC